MAGFLACALPTAQASSISFLDAFKNISNLQTANGNSLTPNGAFYSADLNSSVANAYSSVTMTYPGPGSPLNIPQTTATVYHYQSPGFATQAAMDTAFPFGTYTFTASNGGPADTASFQYTVNDYAQSTPFLTGTDYTSLQGMNPSQAFTFHFSPFVTGSTASSSFIFLTIFDYTKNAFVYNSGFLAPTTSSVTVGANTLAFGDQFGYEIDFSNRDLVASPGAQFNAQPGFDVRTDGLFNSQVAPTPEPSTLALCGLGFVLVIGSRLRKGAF
jgi:hypothetical protein